MKGEGGEETKTEGWWGWSLVTWQYLPTHEPNEHVEQSIIWGHISHLSLHSLV